YSNDLRARVIEAIEAGASRREAADSYQVSASAVVLWAQRWNETGSFAAKPSGGSISPLEEHARRLLALICRAAGFDAGRGRRSDVQARNRRQPSCGMAVLQSPQDQL